MTDIVNALPCIMGGIELGRSGYVHCYDHVTFTGHGYGHYHGRDNSSKTVILLVMGVTTGVKSQHEDFPSFALILGLQHKCLVFP